LHRALRYIDGAVCGEEGFACLGEKEQALRREARATRGAMQESAAYLSLEVGELLADGGLRDVKLTAGFGEGAMVGYGTEVAKMSELHREISFEKLIGFSDGMFRK